MAFNAAYHSFHDGRRRDTPPSPIGRIIGQRTNIYYYDAAIYRHIVAATATPQPGFATAFSLFDYAMLYLRYIDSPQRYHQMIY